MDSEFYKSPWFLTLVGLTLWAWGYVTADDSRIERETRETCRAPAETHRPASRNCTRQETPAWRR